jgi:hypothetical protein
MTIGMIHCARCGSANVGGAQFCSGCGSQLRMVMPPPPPAGNGRAVIALVLGIAGLFFCGFTAIPGAILAWLEMQAVREGRAPQSKDGMAKIAFWINIVALVLTAVAIVLMGLFGIALM